MSETNSLPETLDAALRKYGKIWVWSILSAASATFSVRTYSSLITVLTSGLNGYSHRPPLSTWEFLFALVNLIPAFAAVVAMWYLLLFLRDEIVPLLFPQRPTEESEGARLLVRAFGAFLAGSAVEFALAIASTIYRLAN